MPRNDSYINMHVRKVLHANHWPAVRRAGWLATLSLSTRDTRLGSSPSRPATPPSRSESMAEAMEFLQALDLAYLRISFDPQSYFACLILCLRA